MKDRSSRRPLRRGAHFDSLETRALLSHVSPAAIEAHLLRMQQAALIQTATPALANHATTPAITGTSGGGGFQPVSNTYSPYDIYSNYIGGSVGLQAFVDGLYINVLHRAPDTAGVTFWTTHLDNGTVAPYTVVSEFLIAAGSEPLHPTNPPPNIYTAYLGGNVGVTAFVDGLYHDVLQRAPDPAGEAAWVNAIEGPSQLLPAKVTFAFLASPEYQSHLG
jgi:hypothetical protein